MLLLLFVQLSLLVQLASKGKGLLLVKLLVVRLTWSSVQLLIVKVLIMPLLLFVHADHATAAARAVAAREARFKGETAGAREAAASVAGAR